MTMATKKSKKAVDTRSEWDKQVENDWSHDWLRHRDPQPVPASRRVDVGQSVRYGNLIDVRVEEVRDEGRTLVLSYANRGESYGKPYDHGNRLPRVVRWHDTLPIVEARKERFSTDDNIWRRLSPRQSTLDSLVHNVRRSGLIDSPEYQRGYVWTDADRARLIKSIFDQSDLGKFILVEHDWPETRLEVLDGKQRIKTILDFMDSRFAYEGAYYHELHWRDRLTFDQTLVQWVEVRRSQVKQSDLLWLFLTVNAGGVPQSDEHIAHVRELYDAALAKEKGV
jgi:hypothetical protein